MERRDSKRSIFKALFKGFYEKYLFLRNRVAFSSRKIQQKSDDPFPSRIANCNSRSSRKGKSAKRIRQARGYNLRIETVLYT